jgi:hypothetical protein
MNPLWIVCYNYVKLIDVYMWRIYVDWTMNVVGDCIYDEWWWIVVNCIYTNCWWWCGDLFLWTYAFVVESYVHAFMTDGGGFYIPLRWLWCFCCIMGDDLEETWYHMHICVELGAYHCSMSLKCCIEWWMWWKCGWWIHTCDNYNCYANEYMEVNCSCYVVKNWIDLCMSICLLLIMTDVNLTSSGFDRLPVCMDG